MTKNEAKLLHDLELPEPPAPAGSYERCMVYNGIGFVSGQFPLVDDHLAFVGRIGAELSEEEGHRAAEIAAVNVLSQIKAVLGGNFGQLATLLRVDGYVASADGWRRQPTVLDGASNLFVEILGTRGRHARSAFAVSQLPFGAPIELVVTFATEPR